MDHFDKITKAAQLSKWIKLRHFQYHDFLSALKESQMHLSYKSDLHPVLKDIKQYSTIFERIDEARKDTLILLYQIKKVSRAKDKSIDDVTQIQRQKLRKTHSLFNIYAFKWAQLMSDVETCINIIGEKNR